jgi:tryptophanyl-tRNA synthetase
MTAVSGITPQLAYLLECTAYVGELSRMVQFTEKGRDKPDDAGLTVHLPVPHGR